MIGALGVTGTGFAADLPLIIAFAVLAAFTYSSGLRAPASIAIVKDILIYVATFAIIIVVPIKLGGFAQDLRRRPAAEAAARGAGPAYHGRLQRLCDAGARLGTCAVPLPAFAHGHLEREQRPGHPPQRRHAAGLFVHAGAARAWSACSSSPPASPTCRIRVRASRPSATTSRCRR